MSTFLILLVGILLSLLVCLLSILCALKRQARLGKLLKTFTLALGDLLNLSLVSKNERELSYLLRGTVEGQSLEVEINSWEQNKINLFVQALIPQLPQDCMLLFGERDFSHSYLRRRIVFRAIQDLELGTEWVVNGLGAEEAVGRLSPELKSLIRTEKAEIIEGKLIISKLDCSHDPTEIAQSIRKTASAAGA